MRPVHTTKKAGRSIPPYAYTGLDRVIHERARLGILTSLASQPKGLHFGELKQLCGLTDGNLSRHLQVLVAGELVETSKYLDDNSPRTLCRLTAFGRKRYTAYLLALEAVVRDAVAAVKGASARRGSSPA